MRTLWKVLPAVAFLVILLWYLSPLLVLTTEIIRTSRLVLYSVRLENLPSHMATGTIGLDGLSQLLISLAAGAGLGLAKQDARVGDRLTRDRTRRITTVVLLTVLGVAATGALVVWLFLGAWSGAPLEQTYGNALANDLRSIPSLRFRELVGLTAALLGVTSIPRK